MRKKIARKKAEEEARRCAQEDFPAGWVEEGFQQTVSGGFSADELPEEIVEELHDSNEYGSELPEEALDEPQDSNPPSSENEDMSHHGDEMENTDEASCMLDDEVDDHSGEDFVIGEEDEDEVGGGEQEVEMSPQKGIANEHSSLGDAVRDAEVDEQQRNINALFRMELIEGIESFDFLPALRVYDPWSLWLVSGRKRMEVRTKTYNGRGTLLIIGNDGIVGAVRVHDVQRHGVENVGKLAHLHRAKEWCEKNLVGFSEFFGYCTDAWITFPKPLDAKYVKGQISFRRGVLKGNGSFLREWVS